MMAELQTLNTVRDSREEYPDWRRLRDYDGSALLLQPFMQGRYRFSEKLSINAGVHGIYYGLNETSNIEPRASAQLCYRSHQNHHVQLWTAQPATTIARLSLSTIEERWQL